MLYQQWLSQRVSTVVFDGPSGSMLKALFAACTTRRIWPLVEAGAVLWRGATRLQLGKQTRDNRSACTGRASTPEQGEPGPPNPGVPG